MPIIPDWDGEYDEYGYPIFTANNVPETGLTDEQTQVFEYVNRDYIADNPDYVSSQYLSYLGIYFSANGDITPTYVANPEVPTYD